jgi:dTDP-4-amino-4,6-dideoxygalactose transaminase
MKVSRYNYPSQFGDDFQRLLQDIKNMILQGHYILTDEVRQFELDFARCLGAQHACGVNCGTDALVIALFVLGVKDGAEVITQANTFHATVAAIRLAGATPVLVDANEESFLIDESQVEAAITARTRVILPVHLYGKPTPMEGLLKLAERKQIDVIEDAAQAHGAQIGNRTVGTFGIMGCFSFHPSKNLAAAGDGGAIVTDSEEMNERIQLCRALGQSSQNDHVTLGLNSKLDAIQARILSWKLPYLQAWNQARREVAEWYRDRLNALPIQFQKASLEEKHVYHLFQVRTDARDRLLTHLRTSGVDAVVRYPTPIHLQRAFSDCGWREGQFPIAERLARELLCLPIRPDMSIDEVDFVADRVSEFFGH